LNSVCELDAASLDQIRQACCKQTEKLDETEATKDKENDDEDPDLPPPESKTEINQKYQSSTDREATLVRQHGFKTRPRYKSQRVVDDAQGVVTAVRTTTGRINFYPRWRNCRAQRERPLVVPTTAGRKSQGEPLAEAILAKIEAGLSAQRHLPGSGEGKWVRGLL
jgi:hypothetical protein